LAAATVALLLVGLGASASATDNASARAHDGIFLKIAPRPPKQRPRSVAPVCCLSNPPAGHKLLHWKHWGSPPTHARGLLIYNTCKPSCAEGYRSGKGTVRLNGVRRCHGQRRYTKLHFLPRHHRRYRVDVRLDCHGNASFL
jgi:hypothetical protein